MATEPSELPALVFDVYRFPDVVDGESRMVTLAMSLDGVPMLGVSRQATADEDMVRVGVTVALVKARPRLTARDRAVLRHALVHNGLPDPHDWACPLEDAWDKGVNVNPTYRANIRRGVLPSYVWLNGRYQVALAMCEAGRLNREKLHDLTMEYAGELLAALSEAEVTKAIVSLLKHVGVELQFAGRLPWSSFDLLGPAGNRA